jgi:hypothetical protein
MKTLSTFIFFSLIFSGFGQQQLKDIDTSFDYQERFYENGQLIAENSWRLVYPDGTPSIPLKDLYLNPDMDTSEMSLEQDGLWVEYYDKKWNEVDSSRFYYKVLREYDCGYTQGKSYYFKKNELMYTGLRYPKLNDSVFNGSRKIIYDKGNISWVEYRLFMEDSLRNKYYHSACYFPDGQLMSYNLSDDINYQYVVIRYNKAGLCTYELKLNHQEAYRIKRKRKGRKEIMEVRENRIFTRTVKINGKEVRQRKHT